MRATSLAEVASLEGSMRLIGGHADGRNVQVHADQNYIIIAETPSFDYRRALVPEPYNPPKEHLYDVMKFAGSSEVFSVGVSRGLTGDDCVRKLIEGYNP